ncbi:hypothetical protein [Actinomadura latina]|uniref:Uncharacterized protein n=1 Tax=Actinomadura latina TaxID=163603 RepID=A0A846Z865_9ACTN|nr:hypothetical protein [Actinomadura latina]NKZ06954.1 hypothetical protein [Actinomadura latina]
MTEWDEEALARLRAAAHTGDGDAGVLRGRPLEPVLQYAGDVLVAALAKGRTDAELARECLNELHERDLPGDAELAAELAAALGTRPAEPLVPLPVDLGAVAAAMDDGDQVLDLARGDVLPADDLPAYEGGGGCGPPGDEIPHGGRGWLPIPPAAVPRGEDAQRGAARKWLAGEGYRAVPRRL